MRLDAQDRRDHDDRLMIAAVSGQRSGGERRGQRDLGARREQPGDRAGRLGPFGDLLERVVVDAGGVHGGVEVDPGHGLRAVDRFEVDVGGGVDLIHFELDAGCF